MSNRRNVKKPMSIKQHFKPKFDPTTAQHEAHMDALLKAIKAKDLNHPFLNRHVGIEIEVERATTQYPLVLGGYTKDGSLKDVGVEIVSLPINGAGIAAFLIEYDKFLQANKNCVFTHRCSVHVHVNVNDLTVPQYIALIAAYLCLEDLFFLKVEPIRRNNSFCAALCDYNINPKQCLVKQANADHNAYKYAALNFAAVGYHGTVEFRHLEGTKDIKKLSDWILLCQRFVDYFSKCDPDSVFSAILALNSVSYYDLFVDEIFGGKNPWVGVDLHKIMSPCVTQAKAFLSEQI